MRVTALFIALCFPAFPSFSQEKTDIKEYMKLLEQARQMEGQQSGSSGEFEVLMKKISGEVKIKPGGSKEYKVVDGTSYYPVDPDDTIKTGSTGFVELYFDNVGLIKVDRNTEVEIGTLDAQDTKINLLVGALIGKFEKLVKKKFSLNIHSPTAVCAVRGTEFAVEHSLFNNQTTFGVFDEGKISVTPNQDEGSQTESREILVGKGNELTISPATQRVEVVRLFRLTKYRSAVSTVRKNLSAFAKKWRKLSSDRREKLRNALIRTRLQQGRNGEKMLKGKAKKAVKRRAVKKKREAAGE